MLRLICTILLLALTTTACSSYRKELDGNPPFSSHSFRYYDLAVEWRTEQTSDGLRLTGTVSNRRAYYLQDLELTVRIMDGKGSVLARETYADFPNYLPPSKSSPFRIELRLSPATTPERLRFSYIYWLAEAAPELRGYGGAPYFGNFDSPP